MSLTRDKNKKNQTKNQMKSVTAKPKPHDQTHPDSGAQMSFQEHKNGIAELREEFMEMVTTMQSRFEQQLAEKDVMIKTLNNEIVDIKKSLQYMSDKLEEERNDLKETNEQVKQVHEVFQVVKDKTEDLEDRGRRNNLVFFNVPEIDNSNGLVAEDCESRILGELDRLNMLGKETVFVDRAHRLGSRKSNQDHPRPIIV